MKNTYVTLFVVLFFFACKKERTETNVTPASGVAVTEFNVEDADAESAWKPDSAWTAAAEAMDKKRREKETVLIPFKSKLFDLKILDGAIAGTDSLFHLATYLAVFTFEGGKEQAVTLTERDVWHKNDGRPVGTDSYHYCHTCIIEESHQFLQKTPATDLRITIGDDNVVAIALAHDGGAFWRSQEWDKQFSLVD